MPITNLKYIKNINPIFILAVIFFLAIAVNNSHAQLVPKDGTCSSSSDCQSGLYCDSNKKCKDSINSNAFTKVMCRVLGIAKGTGGKAFAAFAIISVGIGFFTGKVSWGLMIGVAAGIAVIFGAPSIVAAISGENEADCSEYE